MAKRPSDLAEEEGNQAYLKRQKIKHVATSAESIQSSRQLQKLLAFDQDAGRARHGIIGTFNLHIDLFTDTLSRHSVF